MQIVSYTHARQNLAAIMQKAHDDQDAIIITRNGHEPTALIPLDMLESWQETAYLTSTRRNKEELDEAIKQLERGEVVSYTLEEFFAKAEKDAR